MAVSNESIICPHCGCVHEKSKGIGTTGLINMYGYEDVEIICRKCGREFYVDIILSIEFSTSSGK